MHAKQGLEKLIDKNHELNEQLDKIRDAQVALERQAYDSFVDTPPCIDEYHQLKEAIDAMVNA